MWSRREIVVAVAIGLGLGLLPSSPAVAGRGNTFLASEDAEEENEPQEFLPDYSKLVEGSDADWIYFPKGGLKSYERVEIGEFGTNARAGHKTEARHAADYVPEYLEQWLRDQGFDVVDSGGDMVLSGNIFDAWEPSGGARFWGGWMANPGCGIEVIAKDGSGQVLGYVRHKARGSTIPDAIENGLEEIVKAIAKGK